MFSTYESVTIPARPAVHVGDREVALDLSAFFEGTAAALGPAERREDWTITYRVSDTKELSAAAGDALAEPFLEDASATYGETPATLAPELFSASLVPLLKRVDKNNYATPLSYRLPATAVARRLALDTDSQAVYEAALFACVAAVGEALSAMVAPRGTVVPARKADLGGAIHRALPDAKAPEPDPVWDAVTRNNAVVSHNWTRQLPALRRLAASSETVRSAMTNLSMVEPNIAGTYRVQTLNDALDALSRPADPGTATWLENRLKKAPCSETTRRSRVRVLFEDDMLPGVQQSSLARFVGSALGGFDVAAVRACESPAGREGAVAMLDHAVSNNGAYPEIAQALFRLSLESAPFQGLLGRAAALSGKGPDYIVKRYVYNNWAPKVDEADSFTYQQLEDHLRASHLFTGVRTPPFDLAETAYADDVPDSEEVDVSIIGDVDAYARELVASGALGLVDDMSQVSPTKLEGTRYVVRAADRSTGLVIGYLYMTDYFRTNYTWRINEARFRELYGKIRYRVSVIRKHARLLEELDL